MARDAEFAATLANYVGQKNYAAGLDSTGLVPTAQMATGATSTTTFLRGDRTWGTAGGVYSGGIVQMLGISVSGFTTTTGLHAGGFDNVPIKSTEGSGFGLTLNMKPTNTANTVYVKGDFYGANDSIASDAIFWGLFLAGSTTAIAAGGFSGVGSADVTDMIPISFLWKATTVSTATTSYAIRLGTASAGPSSFTLNGQAGAGLFGNAVVSSLVVWEVQN